MMCSVVWTFNLLVTCNYFLYNDQYVKCWLLHKITWSTSAVLILFGLLGCWPQKMEGRGNTTCNKCCSLPPISDQYAVEYSCAFSTERERERNGSLNIITEPFVHHILCSDSPMHNIYTPIAFSNFVFNQHKKLPRNLLSQKEVLNSCRTYWNKSAKTKLYSLD